jgi:hypothetical protein
MKGKIQAGWAVKAVITDFRDRFPLDAPWVEMIYLPGDIKTPVTSNISQLQGV